MSDYFRVLVVGGTGAISHSCVTEAVAQGMRVTALNRGRSSTVRSLPESVELLTADITDPRGVETALGDRRFDAVVNFLCFGADDAAQSIELFSDRTSHYVHISSASVYHRPLPKGPVSESTFAHNPDHAYMRNKVEAEGVFLAAFAERSFPVTIVRPAHTYDEAIAPLPGGWAVIDRIERGEPVVVHGDGTSMWTYTHAADLAVGLVGLLGRPSVFGEAFHITSDDVLSWNQIYLAIGHAMGVEPKILHIPTDFIIARRARLVLVGAARRRPVPHRDLRQHEDQKLRTGLPPDTRLRARDLQDSRLAQSPPQPRQGTTRRRVRLHTASGKVRTGPRHLRQPVRTASSSRRQGARQREGSRCE